jgi:hypothetical protein
MPGLMIHNLHSSFADSDAKDDNDVKALQIPPKDYNTSARQAQQTT